MKRKLTIKFLSDWIVSSGLGDGSRADQVLVRDENGLLFLPGRSIKGILREASRELEAAAGAARGITEDVFGSRDNDNYRDCGRIRVGRGELETELKEVLLNLSNADRKQFVADLTVIRSQTAINDNTGTAKDKTLRRIECGVPGILFTAGIELDVIDGDSATYDEYLKRVCAMARVMGAGKYRGFGRCEFSVRSETAKEAMA